MYKEIFWDQNQGSSILGSRDIKPNLRRDIDNVPFIFYKKFSKFGFSETGVNFKISQQHLTKST